MKQVAFVNGFVFNSDTESFEKLNIVCKDGFIVDITNEMPSNATIIDVGGKHLIPGMIDVHTHGIAGFDFNVATTDEVEKMCKAYAKYGTTSVMATLASDTLPRLMNSIFEINPHRLKSKGANVLGVHMEGRYLNPDKRGAHALELLALPSLEELNSLAMAMMPSPLHFSLAPELEGAKEFIKNAISLGATIGIAHTNATYEESLEAVSFGARSFTHTFNAMTPVHHRMPGATVAAMTCDQAYAEVICDGQHLHPAIVKLIYRSKPRDKMVLITDSLAAAGSPDGEYSLAGAKYIVKNGCCINEHGTIAGSTLTLFEGLKNFMKFCKVPFNKAIKYATINPARMVGADFVGKLEKNYRADIIILSNVDNPTIDSVYVGGNKVD